MGMCIDAKVGERVLARIGSEEISILVERKSGTTGVRLNITAPARVELVPPNKQGKNLGHPEKLG